MDKKAIKISHHEIYDELQKRRRDIRRIIKPGPWTNISVEFSVVAKLKKYESKYFNFPPFLGKYLTCDDGYSGDGYRAIVSIVLDNLSLLIKNYGINKILAACEKSLNSYKNSSGKKVLGDVVIIKLVDDRADKEEKYLTCIIKTNRKRIPKFMGLQEGTLKVF